MGYYYVCEQGKRALEAREPLPIGALSPELQVTMHSGAVALCFVPHAGLHTWRQVISTDEERVVREHGVVYVARGEAEPPAIGSRWRSPQGYCQVAEKVSGPDGGTYVLVRFMPAARQER